MSKNYTCFKNFVENLTIIRIFAIFSFKKLFNSLAQIFKINPNNNKNNKANPIIFAQWLIFWCRQTGKSLYALATGNPFDQSNEPILKAENWLTRKMSYLNENISVESMNVRKCLKLCDIFKVPLIYKNAQNIPSPIKKTNKICHNTIALKTPFV